MHHYTSSCRVHSSGCEWLRKRRLQQNLEEGRGVHHACESNGVAERARRRGYGGWRSVERGGRAIGRGEMELRLGLRCGSSGRRSSVAFTTGGGCFHRWGSVQRRGNGGGRYSGTVGIGVVQARARPR